MDDPKDDPIRGGNAASAASLAPVRPSPICSEKGQTMHIRRFMGTTAVIAEEPVDEDCPFPFRQS